MHPKEKKYFVYFLEDCHFLNKAIIWGKIDFVYFKERFQSRYYGML